MVCQKSACLDTDEPRTQKKPHPATKMLNLRLDIKYDQEMNHPLKLTGNLVSRNEVPGGEAFDSMDTPSKQPSRRSEFLF